MVEKISVCFLCVSCAKNVREAWVSLKERYKPTTVAEELKLLKKFNGMRLDSVQKNLVEILCVP